MNTPESHIHYDCIIAWAADPTRRVQHYSETHKEWFLCRRPAWFQKFRYRVFDHDGTVVAETPPPKRTVRIPEAVLPAPIENAVRGEYAWAVSLPYGGAAQTVRTPIVLGGSLCEFMLRSGRLFATAEDAQQWADFLNTKWDADALIAALETGR